MAKILTKGELIEMEAEIAYAGECGCGYCMSRLQEIIEAIQASIKSKRIQKLGLRVVYGEISAR